MQNSPENLFVQGFVIYAHIGIESAVPKWTDFFSHHPSHFIVFINITF